MAVTYIDRINNVEMTERNGAVKSLTRVARVIFDDQDAVPQDPRALLLALQAAGIPSPLDTFPGPQDDIPGQQGIPIDPNSEFNTLTLVERNCKIAEGDPRIVDVTLKYEHLLDGPNQQIYNTPSGILYGKGRCSITLKPTNFFYPFGDRSQGIQSRIQILTAHTYSKAELTSRTPPAGFIIDPTNWPETLVQGGEIHLPFPQANFQLEGVLRVEDPWELASQLIPSINENTWLSQDPLTWLCSEMQWDILDPKQNTYRFQFQFQHDPDTWDRTVVFIDSRTGKPPAFVRLADQEDNNGISRLNQNTISSSATFQPAGYWTVPAIKRVDYNQIFASYFEGTSSTVEH